MEFEGSRQRVRDGAAYVAGGVNSGFRVGIRPTPLVFADADGPYLVDVDGNRYIDYFAGMGPMLLGHRPASVIAAARDQLERSILVAGQTDMEYAAAQLLCELVPSAERVRFSTTGSEAVQAAIRLARAATGRSIVLKFEGHYHGWFDNVLWSVAPDPALAGPADSPIPQPGSEGQLPVQSLEVLPWNSAELVAARLAKGDIAAVIMEPIMFNSGGVQPVAGYLESVRDACTSTGTVLIFDEVITGFRVAPGGAQEKLGVLPDLTVLAKALGNGFPVAALAGRADLMDLIGAARVLHGGTYNTQSIAMAATLATLREVRSGRPYEAINTAGGQLIAGLRAAFAECGLPAVVVGYPAVFHVRFGGPAIDYRSALLADRAKYADFAERLVSHGVRILPRGTWFVSAAHGAEQIEATLAAVREVLPTLEDST